MTASAIGSKDKTVICLVCGKVFPRGPVDLARHSTAITLQHLITKKQKPNFVFACTICNIYFASKDHLDMHLQHVCSVRKSLKQCSFTASKQKPSLSDSQNEEPQVKKSHNENNSSDVRDSNDRTMECMICGKLFPRGPIDLARHATGMLSFIC